MDDEIKNEICSQLLEAYKDLEISYNQERLVELLREVQEIFGYIPKEIQGEISSQFEIKQAVISSIIKLYPSLKAEPSRHKITICMGRQCCGNNCGRVMEAIVKTIGVGKGETTSDNRFTLSTRSCLKHCRTAPNVMVDDDLYTFVSPKEIPLILNKYK